MPIHSSPWPWVWTRSPVAGAAWGGCREDGNPSGSNFLPSLDEAMWLLKLSRPLGSCSWKGKEGEPCSGGVVLVMWVLSSRSAHCGCRRGELCNTQEGSRHKMPMKMGQSSDDRFPPQKARLNVACPARWGMDLQGFCFVSGIFWAENPG